MKIILGSSSKNRKQVMEEIGYKFEIISPDIDEKAIRTKDYYKLSLLVAKAKTQALLSKIKTPAILITADQIVVCNGALYEKPQSDDEVRKFFDTYNVGNPAETVSALVVTNTETGKSAEGVDVAKVYFSPFPAELVESYIKSKLPFSHAGGFAHEDEFIKPYVKKTEGTRDSIMGMPIKLLEELIRKVDTQK